MRATRYLEKESASNPIVAAVLKHKARVTTGGGWTVHEEAEQIASTHQVELADLEPVVLKTMQLDAQKETVMQKKVHAVFLKETERAPGKRLRVMAA